MKPLAYRAGNISFRFKSNAQLSAVFEGLFGAFQSHSSSGTDIEIEWQEDLCRVSTQYDTPFQIRVLEEASRVSVTLALLQRLLADALEEGYLFHGNVVESSSGILMLFLGESGSGKTTLSQTICSKGWKYISEDLILIDAEGDLVPFPRALAIKQPVTFPRDGSPLPGKQLMPFPNRKWTNASLDQAEIVFLQTPKKQVVSQNEQSGWSAWTSWADISLHDKVRHEFGECYADVDGQLVRFDFAGDPDQTLIRALDAFLLYHSSLLLQTGRRSQFSSVADDRPVLPKFEQIEASEGLIRLQEAGIPGFEAREVSTGRALLAMASCFKSSSFYDLLPGGTPEGTVDTLLEKLER